MSKWSLSRNGDQGGCRKLPSCSWDLTSTTVRKEPTEKALNRKGRKDREEHRSNHERYHCAPLRAASVTRTKSTPHHKGHEERLKPTTESIELHRGRTQSKPRSGTTG